LGLFGARICIRVQKRYIIVMVGFPCSGRKTVGYCPPTTVVYTEESKACIQAMTWSEAVEPTQAAQHCETPTISAIAGLSGLHLGSCWICLKLEYLCNEDVLKASASYPREHALQTCPTLDKAFWRALCQQLFQW